MPCSYELVTPTTFGSGKHTGGPCRELFIAIRDHTKTWAGGKRSYRKGYNMPWQKLVSSADFAELNRVLDSYRRSVHPRAIPGA